MKEWQTINFIVVVKNDFPIKKKLKRLRQALTPLPIRQDCGGQENSVYWCVRGKSFVKRSAPYEYPRSDQIESEATAQAYCVTRRDGRTHHPSRAHLHG
jgi:hypothetical protein